MGLLKLFPLGRPSLIPPLIGNIKNYSYYCLKIKIYFKRKIYMNDVTLWDVRWQQIIAVHSYSRSYLSKKHESNFTIKNLREYKN